MPGRDVTMFDATLFSYCNLMFMFMINLMFDATLAKGNGQEISKLGFQEIGKSAHEGATFREGYRFLNARVLYPGRSLDPQNGSRFSVVLRGLRQISVLLIVMQRDKLYQNSTI